MVVGGSKRKFDEIRIRMLKTLSSNKQQTMNELANNSGLCWRTVKSHIIYLKGKGWAKEVLITPYVRIFEITEKGTEESKKSPEI
jgi:predicted transcriptional regulator